MCTVTAVHSVTNVKENAKFQEEIFSYRFCFVIKQTYALQHIEQRNCDLINIFSNSDRKLLYLNFTSLQLSIPLCFFVNKNIKSEIFISIFEKF